MQINIHRNTDPHQHDRIRMDMIWIGINIMIQIRNKMILIRIIIEIRSNMIAYLIVIRQAVELFCLQIEKDTVAITDTVGVGVGLVTTSLK